MAMLLGKKIGMTQVYDKDGKISPVTVIQAGPCKVTQVKTSEVDGYAAIQLGFADVKKSRQKGPEVGHCKKADCEPKRFTREWRLRAKEGADLSLGDEVKVDSFAEVAFVDVSGTSKGKGFAGCMKRHNFGGFPASRGCKRRHRAPGSISSHASDLGHGGNLKRGKRMAGHMGDVRVTSKNMRLISIDEEKDLLIVKGAVPGAAGGYVEIRCSRTKRK